MYEYILVPVAGSPAAPQFLTLIRAAVMGPPSIPAFLPTCQHLHQVDILSAELVLGQVLSVHNPWVFEDLNCRQALMRIHMEHLGYDVLEGKGER